MLCLPGLTPVANDAHAVGDSAECVVPSGVEAALVDQPLDVGKLAVAGQLLDEVGVHPVEAEDHHLLPVAALRRRSVPERQRSGSEDSQREWP